LGQARELADRYYAATGGRLPSEVAVVFYRDDLLEAADCYRKAGLGLLAGRVGHFARRVALYGASENVRDAWEKFDRLNASGRCPI
jgi:hypothetical protein